MGDGVGDRENKMNPMKDNITYEKAYAFAIRIVRMYQTLTDRSREFVLSKQCLRSGTAIGALVAESRHAQSKADFVSKLTIALKEADETAYWLNLLKDTGYISEKEFISIHTDALELVKILTASTKSLKSKP